MAERKKKRSVKPLKLVFYAGVAGVGMLLAAKAASTRGGDIKRGGKKILKKAQKKIRASVDKLNKRQKKILDLFNREDKITNEMISSVIKGVTKRTLRRDLDQLEARGYIKQVGKTKGSYYVLV